MKALNGKMFKATALAGALFAAPVFFANTPVAPFVGVQVVAAEKQQEKRKVASMTAKVGKRFQPIMELFELDNPTNADWMDGINTLKGYDIERWNGYEKAMYWRYMAGIYSSMEDYANAKKAFISMLDYRLEVQPRMEQDTLLMVAKLETMDENWQSALNYLNDWWNTVPEPTMEGYKIRGSILYQMKDYKGALKDIKVVVADGEKNRGMAKRNEYDMEFGIYAELNKPAEMLRVSEVTVKHYPDATSWKRLYAMYINQEMPKKALSAMQVCYDQGYLDREGQISTLASLWSQADSPYIAAKVFAKGMQDGIVEKTQKNYEYLANWWYQAREYDKSLDARSKAATKSKDGKNWVLLARAQLAESRYKDVVASVDKGIAKGGLRDEAEAYIVKGQAFLSLKQYKSARSAFQKAAKAEGRSSRYAAQYIKFAQTKIDILAKLNE